MVRVRVTVRVGLGVSLGFQVRVRVRVYLATSADTVSFQTLAPSPQMRSLHSVVFDCR
jgi:hypothetical protein